MILDTAFVVDVLRGDHAALALRSELEAGSEPVRVPTVVLYELWEGVVAARNPPREQEVLEETLLGYATMPLKPEHAQRAGAVRAALRRRGVILGDVDLLIAGTALAEDEIVLTRNARDFERVPDLRVRTY